MKSRLDLSEPSPKGQNRDRVRPARPGDAVLLPDIERQAAERFRAVGLDFLADGEPTAEDVFRRAAAEARLWVAETSLGSGAALPRRTETETEVEVVGFALAKALRESLHLQEMDVLPAHGRRGLGRRLVGAVFAAARERSYPKVTLTTFRDIPWNAPFYTRLGFSEVPPEHLSDEMRSLVANELQAGLVPELRCVMSLQL